MSRRKSVYIARKIKKAHNVQEQGRQEGMWFYIASIARKVSELTQIKEAYNFPVRGRRGCICFIEFIVMKSLKI